MDFFAAQARARRISRWLLFWFALAVLAIIGAVYGTLVFALSFGNAPWEPTPWWQPHLFWLTTLLLGGTIAIASFIKVSSLAAGGGALVAASLGGRAIDRSSAEPAERRLLNIVDEMALASGVPVPPVYVLDGETGINAFAAGSRPQQAVIAVTRGALDRLTRDELQGVIGHEFSHILNGDMRLNLQLMGILHGILMLNLAGRTLLRGGSRSDKGAPIIVSLGLVLLVVGSLGVFFGELIKAAVSRQREYLADAAAVQFTRNPQGLADALRRIAGVGTRLQHPRASEVSHMLFGESGAFQRWMATHPPIERRIQRLEGQPWRSVLPASGVSAVRPVLDGVAGLAGLASAPSSPAQRLVDMPPQVAAARAWIDGLPEVLRSALTEPASAEAVLLALLISPEPRLAGQQWTALQGVASAEQLAALAQAVAWVDALPEKRRLPLVGLGVPVLQGLSRLAREQFLHRVETLIQADQRQTLGEYLLGRVLRDALLPSAPPPLVATPQRLREEVEVLLSLMARVGHRAPDAVASAYAQGRAVAPLEGLGPVLGWSAVAPERVDAALSILSATAPGFRRKLVDALVAIAEHDGQWTVAEEESLHAVCGALDCPVPLAGARVSPEKAASPLSPGAALAAVADPGALKMGASTASTAQSAASGISAGATSSQWQWRDRLPLQLLILANLIPVPGVLFFGWDARALLLLYWLENLVVGGYTLLRMLRAGGWRAIGMGAFFSFHYGMFCAGHGMAVLSLSSLGEGVIDPGDNFWPDDTWLPFIPFQMNGALIAWIWQTMPALLGFPLIGFLVSHGVSTLAHHFVGDEDAGRKPEAIMADPYRRIVVLHLAILGGAFLIMLLGADSVAPVLLLLIAGKIWLDIHQHRRVHAARDAHRQSAAENETVAPIDRKRRRTDSGDSGGSSDATAGDGGGDGGGGD